MKKFFYTLTSFMLIGLAANAQEPATDKAAEFDKKFRFGLRVAAQPTWFSSNDNKNKPSGAGFGFGFGLNMEYRFSDIVALSTGIGGDFESGKYQFLHDTANNYTPTYWQNNGGEFVEPKGKGNSDLYNASNVMYVLDSRVIKTTHVTIPVMLKLSTKEYSGMKYFGMFGGELGARIKTLANDSYLETYKFDAMGIPTSSTAETSQNDINISKDGSFPLRVGFNAGLGFEYRLGGSTSAFFSLNYFRSFTNLLKSESKYLVYNVDGSTGTNQYSYVKQNLLLTAIRINVGILF